jgi:hypothetical protein
MANSSAMSSTSSITTILAIPIIEKLSKTNYPLWSAQVLPPIRSAQLYGFLTSDEEQPEKTLIVTIDEKPVQQANPTYASWVTQDQAVLGFLLSSLTRETLMHISHYTAVQAWKVLGNLYSS